MAPSCSLLHVLIDLNQENKLDIELISWLAFAKQKLEEVTLLACSLWEGRESIAVALSENN
ncbi:hypothetical protein [Coxiella-like endosymbiont of Rhipicephalus sanguineus]|uniref:hypothetical protein n=1 Tax=Coxiella-like endosymbiont of Rhipicephalus sanguineus TaxID=1955402 RepID=UPI00203BA7C2|nr:hypothetical protein [Coxiella-like endosymbiont of Rhipicephalus sanguineus]